jgi:hypothetical protein
MEELGDLYKVVFAGLYFFYDLGNMAKEGARACTNYPLSPAHTLTSPPMEPMLRIRIMLIRIRILLVTLMRILILFVTFKWIRILPFIFLRIRIRILTSK